MRYFKTLTFLLAMALALGSAPAWAKTSLKLALVVPLDSAEGQGAVNFKKLVEQRSGGDLEIKVYPGAQLGSSYEIIESQTAGSIEMALHGYDLFAKYSKGLKLAGLAFIFKDRDHAFSYYASPLHQQAKKEILESTGLRVLGNAEWNRGPYKILLTKGPVLSTKDMEGMPMPTPNTSPRGSIIQNPPDPTQKTLPRVSTFMPSGTPGSAEDISQNSRWLLRVPSAATSKASMRRWEQYSPLSSSMKH